MAKTQKQLIAEFEEKMANLKAADAKEVAALETIEGMTKDLSDFLMENKDEIKDASTIGKNTRIKETERLRLREQLELCVDSFEEKNKIKLVVEGIDMLVAGYKLPTAKRMSEEEKAVAFKNTVKAMSDGDEDLAEWLWTNLEAVLSAFKAAIPPPPKKGQVALLAHRMNAAGQKAEEAGDTELSDAFYGVRDLAVTAKESGEDDDIDAAFEAEAVAKALRDSKEAAAEKA